MKKTIFVCLCFVQTLIFANEHLILPDTNINGIKPSPNVSLSDFFISANIFLLNYVVDGKVNYTGISADKISINELVNNIANADLNNADKNTRLSFYLNAYNLLVIKNVVDNLPLNKPIDVIGFFDKKTFEVAGSYMTLNALENNKLRPDPRVHFALVCAAKGCPQIMNEAFFPDKVQTQLDALTLKALNSVTFIKVDDKSKTVKISKIFDWYQDDFIKVSGSAINYINAKRTTPIPASYAVEFYEYDWSLNGK